jgi:uncharacterized transporter YbjL
MTSHDLMMILVMTFPMFIFTIFPGIRAADYLEEKYQISEHGKRAVMIAITGLGALLLSAFLQLS